MPFEPIAIVGQSCVLPGALSPDELWEAVLSGRDLLSSADDSYWRLDKDSILTEPDGQTQDHAWTDRGGYVRGFDERFDPTGFLLPPEQIASLDPLFLWVLHGVREAMQSAGLATPQPATASPIGLVLGNLSYPTFGQVEFAEASWFDRQDELGGPPLPNPIPDATDARNRFSSGLPAHLAAQALALGGDAFSLDSACASSLYAVKLACDRLQDRRADIMIAGAVNRTDDLFIHIGFCALRAMSKQGQSRPFAADADGLVPAEGAAFVVLKRLDDAVTAGDEILGVIRGVGLSNDGMAGGFLSPSEDGQVRAMRNAYKMAGLSPAEVSLLECHATGTPVGDATEIRSAARLFAEVPALPIGSLKSNLGHLITVAGAAGLIKVLAAMRHQTRPPMRPVETPLAAVADTPFRILQAAEPWPRDGAAPRRAAVSAFGFGGNNAHLIVEEWDPTAYSPTQAVPVATADRTPIAIIDLEVTAGEFAGTDAFTRALLEGLQSRALETVDVEMIGLRFPPNDLKHTLPQQLLVFEVARRLARRHAELPVDATSVFVGMGCDPEIARYSARWRLADWAEEWRVQGFDANDDWIEEAKAMLIPGLEAAGVVGTMPNIPANRINTQLDYRGPSHTISAEELSGLRALEVAVDALAKGEIEAALVGAVDLSVEPAHEHAAEQLLPEDRQIAGDAAVVLLLKRLDDAERDGDNVLAILDEAAGSADALCPSTSNPLFLGLAADHTALTTRFGHAHAASGLLHVAAAAIALKERMHPGEETSGQPHGATPWLAAGPRCAHVAVEAMGGQTERFHFRAGSAPTASPRAGTSVGLHVFSGADAAAVLHALEQGVEADTGPARLVIVARSQEELAGQVEKAKAVLAKRVAGGQTETTAPQMLARGIFWSAEPVAGEIAFAFPGAAAAYQGMGRELLLTLPELGERVTEKFPVLARSQHWLEEAGGQPTPGPFEILQGCTLLSQVHAVLMREWLGLEPQAVLGVSSGETNSVFAMDAWHDMDAMFKAMDDEGMYTHEIAGDYATAKRAWQDQDVDEIEWVGWRILAPVAEVEAALADEPLAYLTMINAPADCLIAGQADACARVVDKLGRHRAVENRDEIIAHHPVMKAWEQPWYDIHARETQPVPGVRFYSNASGAHYAPTRETVAAALTDQATAGVDFRRVVNAAWDDGVRIFIELGPRNSCTNYIRSILGERAHFAVALDRPSNGVDQALDAVAQLVAAGVPVNHRALTEALTDPQPANQPADDGPSRALSFPAHYPPVKFPPLAYEAPAAPAAGVPSREPAPEAPVIQSVQVAMTHEIQTMPPAPPLVPVLDERPAPSAGSAPVPAAPAAPTEASPSPAPNAGAPIQPKTSTQESLESRAARAAALAQLKLFHAQVTKAHEQFLAQQTQAMELLQRVKGQTGRTASDTPDDQAAAPAAAEQVTGPAAEPPIVKQSLEPPLTVRASTPAPKPAAQPVMPEKTPITPATDDPKSVPSVTGKVFPGPKLSREQLEHVASSKISEVLGEIFAQQDDYHRQVRMPEPPLLLADRVVGLDAEAGAYGTKGIIWTETDVCEDSWYLHNGHMPAGIMIESGQADLLLISYLGADFANKSERVYRLLGCEATFHGALPAVGETLHFEIHVDGYAQQGDVRLFFFHYDCYVGDRLALSVRHGQAGFFTEDELAASAGVIWDVNATELKPDARLDPPAVPVTQKAFSAEQVIAYSEGRITDCFGDAFWLTKTHVRTPSIANGSMLFFDEVTDFDPQGGPWGRGYLRAEDHLTLDEWFFNGHFKNDPCMPGTLMLEGTLQTMAFYLTAMGYTLDRDGWRFEPIPGETYTLRARGQVTPGAQKVIYEVFVEEVIDGPVPMLYADLLCTVDGLRAFHCRRMGLRLTPAYPLESRPTLLDGVELQDPDPARNARTPDHVYDPKSIAACAWGKPSDAFGEIFARFDGPERCPRLPGPPYLFMTRITQIDAEKAKPVAGGTLEAEYQIPPDAWYFAENGNRTMPYAVLLEAALQPCGWFASYKGTVLQSDEELYFRNLDGTANQLREVFPEDGLLRTHVTNTSLARLGSMTIVAFEVNCFVDEEKVFEMTTSFGFFPKQALADQAGLPATEADRTRLVEPSDFRRELGPRPPRYCNNQPALPGPMLLLLDRVSGFWPEGGAHGLGRVRAEIDVNADDWLFKCHFMGDSVQPGSLGIEAMIQTLQFYMQETNMGAGMTRPRFEPIQLNQDMTWKYRGQVMPSATRVTVDLDVTAREQRDNGAYAIADVSLWVDGLRIYSATGLGMRLVPDPDGLRTNGEERLDPARDVWLNDHCPTWTVPALAMMSMVDRLAAGALVRAPGRRITGLRNVRVHRWLGFADGAQQVRTQGTTPGTRSVDMQLQLWEETQARFATVTSGQVLVGETWPLNRSIWAPLHDAPLMPDPYAAGELFHGPAYQLLTELRMNDVGASFWLDLDRGGVPLGALNQALLDAATHGIPHDALWRWSDRIPTGVAAYPVAIPTASFYGPTPTSGLVRCEARFAGFQDDNAQFPMIDIQIITVDQEGDETLWAEIELVETLFPKGPIGELDPATRRAFLSDRIYTPGAGLSDLEGEATVVSTQRIKESDWLAGTVAAAYGVGGWPVDLDELTRQVAIREHVARQARIHPAELVVDDDAVMPVNGLSRPDLSVVTSVGRPLNRYVVRATQSADGWTAADGAEGGRLPLAMGPARTFWRNQMGVGANLVEDLSFGLMRRFVRRLEIEDREAMEALRGRGVLYLANHQMDLESLLFVLLTPGLQESLTSVVARQELDESWVSPYFEYAYQHPHMTDPNIHLLIDRATPEAVFASLTSALDQVAREHNSLLIHAEGVHARQARQPVRIVSSTLVDLAVERNIPIVPVRFVGGLPLEPVEEPFAFPLDFGQQDVWIGAPIMPDELAGLRSGQRRDAVIAALNDFGGRWQAEMPNPGDPDFAATVAAWQAARGVGETEAVLLRVLESVPEPSDETKWLLAVLRGEAPDAALSVDDVTKEWLATFSREILGLEITAATSVPSER